VSKIIKQFVSTKLEGLKHPKKAPHIDTGDVQVQPVYYFPLPPTNEQVEKIGHLKWNHNFR